MVVARHYGVRHAWPVFIPAPTLFGTLGAIMPMRSLAPNKSALLRVAVAGPLCGFVMALLVSLWGLQPPARGHAQALPEGTARLGHSLVTLILTRAVGGPSGAGMAAYGEPSPVALAGWLGLFWTGLNLTPLGQMDGGHMLFGALGRWHHAASWFLASVLVLLGTWVFIMTSAPAAWVWPLLALGACLFGMRHEGVGDDGAMPLTAKDWALLALAQGLWLSTFVAVPLWPHGALSHAP